MEKLYLPSCGLISEIGRALPKAYVKRPMRICVPDFCTSNHDGKLLPALSIVMSHRPMTAGSEAFFNEAADALIAEKRNNDKMICARIKPEIPL